MSRIGKQPITIPEGVEVKIDGNKVSVKGPKGSLEKEFNPLMNITIENNEVIVTRPNDEELSRSLHAADDFTRRTRQATGVCSEIPGDRPEYSSVYPRRRI